MKLYVVFILATLLLSFIYDKREECHAKNFWYGAVYIALVLMMGFRNGVGGDTQYYMIEFEDVPTLISDYGEYIRNNAILHGYMPGWSLLNIVSMWCFGSFYAVQLIEALIVNSCVFYLFKRYTHKIFLCILLYAFTGYIFRFNTEVMREAIAIGMVSVGMYKYLNGNKLFFYLTILIGFTFHVSAALALLFPLMRFFHSISYKTLILIFGGSFVLWLGSTAVLMFVAQYVGGDSFLVSKMERYGEMKNNIFGFLESALQYLVAQAGILYFAQSSSNQTEQFQSDYPRYAGYFLVLAMIVCAIPGTYRFLNYAAIFTIIMTAEFVGSLKKQLTYLALSKCVVLLIFGFYSCKYYYKVWPESKRHNYEFFVPYTSILDKNPNTEYRYYMWHDAVSRDQVRKK